MKCVVMGGAHCVAWRMGELKLDVFVRVTLLVKECRSDASKAMPCHLPLVAHAFEPLRIVLLLIGRLDPDRVRWATWQQPSEVTAKPPGNRVSKKVPIFVFHWRAFQGVFF